MPGAGWAQLITNSVLCNVLLEFIARNLVATSPVSLILPSIVSLSLNLNVDIDTLRGGLFHMVPQRT